MREQELIEEAKKDFEREAEEVFKRSVKQHLTMIAEHQRTLAKVTTQLGEVQTSLKGLTLEKIADQLHSERMTGQLSGRR